jgi:pimeloyl-ACP methyl ester carboxylesterase
MRRIEKILKSRGFRVVSLRYPSRSRTIEEHADWLAAQVSEKGRGDLYFVGHSLGSIVIRRYLAVHHPMNARRFVMIAPPNHGSVSAEKAAQLGVYRWIYGSKAGMELRSSNEDFWRSLPPPPIEFGILAGGLGDGKGFNPILPGDDDGTVTVDEAKLEGAKELRILPYQHSFILLRKKTAVLTADFLETGSFSR